MKFKLSVVAFALLFCLGHFSNAACINPATGQEYLIENPNGPGLVVLSAHVEPGACMGCGDCIIPIGGTA